MYEIFEKLLITNNITPYRVSKDTGVTQTSLSNWKNKGSTPKPESLRKIADYLNVSVDYLMTGNDREEKYYLNEETARIAQEVFENPELRSLFDVARDIPPEKLQAHIDFIKKMKESERGR